MLQNVNIYMVFTWLRTGNQEPGGPGWNQAILYNNLQQTVTLMPQNLIIYMVLFTLTHRMSTISYYLHDNLHIDNRS